jgi:hypothetical protein
MPLYGSKSTQKHHFTKYLGYFIFELKLCVIPTLQKTQWLSTIWFLFKSIVLLGYIIIKQIKGIGPIAKQILLY